MARGTQCGEVICGGVLGSGVPRGPVMPLFGWGEAAELACAVGACEGTLASDSVSGMTVVELQSGLRSSVRVSVLDISNIHHIHTICNTYGI